MSKPIAKPNSVDGWLAYIEALHPKSIAMGLERVSIVAERLGFFQHHSRPTIITIAGTNGKGSSCAMLEHIYTAAGYLVGCYTSPHLLRYQERVRVNRQEIADDALCAAFAAVEDARQEIELTYFEMGTLAAMWHFAQQALDVLVLEVGLGGRLDAVNIFDADCAIVTNIDLDHMEYLGDTREKIGLEKAGVYRPRQISICGDRAPPQSLMDYAVSIGTHLDCIQQAFEVQSDANGWHYRDASGVLKVPQLSLMGEFQKDNAASVIYAIRALQSELPVADEVIATTLPRVQLQGRFQYLHRDPDVIVDVAHNPQAAQSLFDNLTEIQKNMPNNGRLIAVFAMLADKDIHAVVQILRQKMDVWYVAEINHPRAAKLDQLLESLKLVSTNTAVHAYSTVETALLDACKTMTKNDKIVVFGSFFTVAAALDCWHQAVFSDNHILGKS
ncbi:folylpolyglutamate synthase/dihydrofolate synthase [Methylophilaceae bacterium 11]|uniref:bifunctional tetrahydrofolate synthase/dihydrofolate synthase n=1 Tax=Methylotenera sp. N17 TaxID=1502761 RepID=UPI000452A0D6|nr:bifunctional tetrahydrofolate synthase/dihydrofolate synthase [Methylotenera sp. N17]EUJ10234.1 folylpolyglutamate synthase/dihydrofolate synthase [Methylophilaceae bacterium 11]